MSRPSRPTGRDADPRRTIPLNTAAWQKLRASVLAEDPLCRDCQRMGRVVPATDVDHDDGNPGNNDRDNLVPRCHSCHSHKTMRERHGRKPVMGCDVNGMPLDPDHPWARIVSAQIVENFPQFPSHPWAKVCHELEKSREAGRARPRPPLSFNAKGKEP